MASDKTQSPNSKSVPHVHNRISVLESAKLHLKVLGCLPLPIDQQKWPLRFRKIPINKIHIGFVYLVLILNLLSTCCFYIDKIETFIDFSESVFWISRAILSLVLYSMFIWHKSDFIDLFNEVEDIVDKSEKTFRIFCRFSFK